MGITIKETKIKGKALYILNDGNLVVYKKGSIQIYSYKDEAVLSTIHFQLPLWKRFAVKFRLLERALHLDARWAVEQSPGEILIQFNSKFYILNTSNNTLTEEYIPVIGKPLFIRQIENIPGFNNGYILGDYYGNNNRDPVNLYWKLENTDKWVKCYTFQKYSVRHIHNIIPDKKHKCLYILTGDEDNESGIWVARNNFKDVEPFLVGRQEYRSCQMLVSQDDIFYITDSPSEKNKICKIINNTFECVKDISGTCIYGTIYNGNLIFSTTCEPEAHASNRISYWLSNESGAGIIKNYVDLCILSSDGNVDILDRFEHDGLPLRLFQYGTITFTNFMNNICYLTPMSVRKFDMNIFKLYFE